MFIYFVLFLFTKQDAFVVQGTAYLQILRFTFPFFAVTALLLNALRVVEIVRIALKVSVVSLAINVTINYLLIAGHFGMPELGARGAAIGTLTARIVECFIVCAYVLRDRKLGLRIGDIRISVLKSTLFRDFLAVLRPVLGAALLWGIANAAQTIILGHMNDSAIGNAINLISFLCGNLIAFWVGCRLTNVKAETMFRLRDLGAVRTVKYVLVGLWLQLLTGLLAGWLLPFLRRAGIPVTGHPVSLEGSRSKIMLLVLYCCLIAPVTEELLMRGIVLKNLSRVSQRFGIFMSAFLFAVMHDNLPQFLLTFPLGILLGYITIQHNSLTPAIITHMAVNSFAMLQQFAHRMLERSLFRTAELSYILLLLLLGSAAFFYMLLTERLPDKTPHQSSRGMRLAAGCPLFWAFLCLHAAIVIYAMI